VSERSSFLATTEVDDTFLERIFEFFVGLSGVDRDLSRRLEVEGLGYANLLQLAVVLAAIPDLTREDESGGANEQADRPGSEATDQSASPDTTIRSEEELRAELGLAEAAAAAAEDSFFSEQFNACVLLEEPEAHLHPQLQYGLVHHLKSVVRDRPEIQIILTTHSDEIVAACDIEDLVVCRRSGGGPVSRTIARLPLTDPMKRLANRHLDASRSASMFADRVVVVEGITDAQLLRAFGKVWACDDSSRRAFLDSLTITVVGSRIGSWLPTLLASPDQEIATRVALLMDSDGKPKPRWAIERENDTVRVFLNEPTLEPSIYSANADLCLGAMVDLGYDEAELDAPPTEDDVAAWFSGTGRRTKARFADTIDAQIEEDISVATLPEHFGALLEFIYEGHEPAVDEETEEAAEIAVTE
jgi:putative ATP-dependent endonuclease of OLD family